MRKTNFPDMATQKTFSYAAILSELRDTKRPELNGIALYINKLKDPERLQSQTTIFSVI